MKKIIHWCLEHFVLLDEYHGWRLVYRLSIAFTILSAIAAFVIPGCRFDSRCVDLYIMIACMDVNLILFSEMRMSKAKEGYIEETDEDKDETESN